MRFAKSCNSAMFDGRGVIFLDSFLEDERQLRFPLRGRTNPSGKDAAFHRTAFPEWKLGYAVDLKVGGAIWTVVASDTIRAIT